MQMQIELETERVNLGRVRIICHSQESSSSSAQIWELNGKSRIIATAFASNSQVSSPNCELSTI